MKKFKALLLVILLLSPVAGLAAKKSVPKGVKMETLQQRMIASTEEFFKRLKAPIVEMDDIQSTSVVDRIELTSKVATVNMFACSFADTDILEYGAIYCPLGSSDSISNAYSVGFLAGTINNKKAFKRLQAVGTIVTTFLHSASYDMEIGSAVLSAQNGNYNYYMLNYGEHGIIYILSNTASTLTVKDLYDITMEKLVDQSYIRQPEQATAAGAVTLSVGTYTCPAHIPAGESRVTPQKGGSVFVRREGKLLINEVLYPDKDDEIGRLVLQDGDEIEIAGGAKFVFSPLK